MVLYCKRLNDTTWQLYCQTCLVRTDVVDTDCVVYHQLFDVPHYCMSCDSLTADHVPDALYLSGGEYDIMIDNVWIPVDYRGKVGYRKRIALVDPDQSSCLSS